MFSAGEDRTINGWKFNQETKLFDAAVRMDAQLLSMRDVCPREVLAQAMDTMHRFNASPALQFSSSLVTPMVPLLYGT